MLIQTSLDENESQSSFETASTPSQYVGHSSEINFTKLIIANLQSRTLAAKSPKLTEALMSIHPRRPPAVHAIANDLPSSVVALQLIKSYFIGHHIVSPFLSRKEILNLHMSVYQHSDTTRTTDNGFKNACQSHQNLFRLIWCTL
ncbi:unnamed protein product [Clonostachys rosea f. rosea IK726]|nr:unnamed protein product [Clonostachys rosea f. rosea IK726]